MEVRRLLSTVIVNTLADETIANSTTSLREAITAAAAGDTVQFQPGLSGTITLTKGELLIDKNLTLAGPGAKTIAVSGNDGSRVLRIAAGATVSIAGLTIRDGGGADQGAGIYNAGSLTLSSCTLANNTARGADAVAPQAGLPASGGGIYNTGTLAVGNGTFTSNTAVGGDGQGEGPPGGDGRGGAIYSIGVLTVLSSSFASNTAVGGSGAISNAVATTGSGSGGAITVAGTSGATISQSTFSGNTARGGTGSTISPGISGGEGRGGAVHTTGGGTLNLTGNTFTNNQAVGGTSSVSWFLSAGAARGGAIYTESALSVSGGKFALNTAAGGAGTSTYPPSLAADGMGGAVWTSAASTFSGVTFDGNRAKGGDGGECDVRWYYREYGGSGTGGAVYSSNAAASFERSTFVNNAALGGLITGDASAGAIYSGGGDDASLTVTNSTFASNRAEGAVQWTTPPWWYAAGAAAAQPHPDITPEQDEPTTSAKAVGGAVTAMGALTVSGSTFSANTAVGGDGRDAREFYWWSASAGGSAFGGAIYAAGGGTISRSTLYGNSVVAADGGDGAEGDEDYQYPPGNGGAASGGAIRQPVDATASLTLIACTIAGNTTTGGAAGTPATGGTATASDGVESGGGVSGSAVTFANTLVATNAAGEAPDVSGTITSNGFNLIGKSNGSTGWVASDKSGTVASPLDPRLGPLAGNGGPTKTMALLPDSAALDAGKAFGLTTDQRDEERPRNLASVPNAPGGDGSDIGAFELQALAPIQTPFKTFVIGATPLTMEAEDFDDGGESIAYHDVNASNLGGAYRNTGVDIQPTTDAGGGYNVGWAKAGEWIEYTATVQTAGKYDVEFRVASNGAGGSFNLLVDGNNLGTMSVPNTGGWQSWKNLTMAGVSLTAGKHVFRIAMSSPGVTGSIGNFNYLRFTRADAGTVTVNTSTAAHVRDGPYRGVNYGTSPTLEVKKSSIGYNREAYLKFDMGGVASIASGKLRVYGGLADALTSSIQLGVYSASSTGWTESALTWLNKPATGSTPLATTTISGTTKKWYEIDLTSFLNAEKAAGRNVVTLALTSLSSTSTLCAFSSDEAALNSPQLLVAK